MQGAKIPVYGGRFHKTDKGEIQRHRQSHLEDIDPYKQKQPIRIWRQKIIQRSDGG